MKKIISLILVILLMSSLLSASVLAEEESLTAAEEEIITDAEETASGPESEGSADMAEEPLPAAESTDGEADEAEIVEDDDEADEAEIVEKDSEEIYSQPSETADINDFWVNPVYEAAYEAGLLHIRTSESQSLPSGTRAAAYTTVEEAAVYVREQMRQRNEVITFSIIISGEYDSSVWKSIIQTAYAHTGIADEGDYIRYNFGGYSMRASISGNTYTPTYTMTYLSNADQEQAVDAEAANVISALALDGKSDSDKIRLIHDYVLDRVTYDYDHLDQDYDLQYTSYAALIQGTSVCQGYASLTYRLMLMAGIDCRVITGKANNGSATENHAWNIVKVNGKYYYLDTTWDDGTHSYRYYLKSGFSDHYVDESEFTAAFYASYPIASSDFVSGEDVYAVTIAASGHGTVTSDKASAGVGERVTLTAAPAADGILDSLTVSDNSGTPVAATLVSDGIYIFDMPVGGAAVTALFREVVVPAFKTHSVTLAGQIGVNFYLDLPEIEGVNWNESYMLFTVSGKRTRVYFDADFKNASGKYYGFTCGVSSIQMAETITAEFHYGNGLTISETYSVKQYMEVFDQNKRSFDEFTCAVFEAMADYGHYVQPFLSKNNGWTIGKDYAEMDHYYMKYPYDIPSVKGFVSDFEIAKTIRNDEILKINYTLVMDSETAIKVFFTPVEGYDGRFTVTVNYKAATAEKQADGRYMVKIPNISAHLLGTTYRVIAITDAGAAAIVDVSALSYVKGILDAYTDPDYQNGVASLYYYYEAADTYKNNQ